MRNDTRLAFNKLNAQLAQLNGVEDVTKTFSVAPSVQQTLETKIQESSAFLKKINIIGVQEQEGEKLGLGITSPIASRTNTATAQRQPRDPHNLTGNKYRCEKTNFDTALKYAIMDAWAKFPDFQLRVRNAIINQQALDRIMIGWNGVSVAADTNIATNPLLQDVNKGWLQHLREDAPERVLNEGKATGKVVIGSGGTADYHNLDALVYDLATFLDPWHKDNTNVVAILGSKLMHDKYFPMVNDNDKPTEKLAADIIISQKRVGGRPAVTVPFFPENGVMLTTLDNLSIYWQEGARRRNFIENPSRDRVENYESSNDAYVIEDYGLAAFAENIQFSDA